MSEARRTRDIDGGNQVHTFEEVYAAHSAELLRYVSRRIGPTDAEDVVADVFVAAMRGWHTYDPAKGPPRAWLYRITTRLLGRRHRQETQRLLAGARDSTAAAVDGPEATVTARVDAARRLARLTRDIAALSPDDRDVLLLSAWADLNATEIAAALDIPAGTARSRLHRVRRQLGSGRLVIRDRPRRRHHLGE